MRRVVATLNGWPQPARRDPPAAALGRRLSRPVRNGAADVTFSAPQSAPAAMSRTCCSSRASAMRTRLRSTARCWRPADISRTHGEAWSAKQPVSIGFPQDLLRDQNELTIQLRGDAGRRAGLVPIMLGPSRLVEPHYTQSLCLPCAAAVGRNDVQRAGFSVLPAAVAAATREALRMGLYRRSGVGTRRSRHHDGMDAVALARVDRDCCSSCAPCGCGRSTSSSSRCSVRGRRASELPFKGCSGRRRSARWSLRLPARRYRRDYCVCCCRCSAQASGCA